MSGKEKPLVTFALFAYNQEEYIREAVESALAQDYEPLEIIISDDYSSDGTVDAIRETVSSYSGPHAVTINVNEKNLGLINHVNKVVSMCSGRLIVVAAGDDISHNSRAATLTNIFINSETEPLLIHSPVEKISKEGHSIGLKYPPLKSSSDIKSISKISEINSVYIGASAAWNKKLFEIYGPIKYPAAYEDIVLGTRAAMMNGLAYCSSPLLRYRSGAGITTSNEKLRSIKLFVSWRKAWITTMEHVYLQRVEDADKVDFCAGRAKMKKRLDSYSARRRIYEGGNARVTEVTSNPVMSICRIVLELAAISTFFLYRVRSVMRSGSTNPSRN